jgi:hypothetical protein
MQPRQAGCVPAGLRETAGLTSLVPDAGRATSCEADRRDCEVEVPLAELAAPEDMEWSTTTCPCAADMPGAEDMPLPDSATTGAGAFSSGERPLDRPPARDHGESGASPAATTPARRSHAHDTLVPWRTARAAASSR